MSQPRDCLKDKSRFGRDAMVEWKTGVEAVQLASAEVQHRCALAMRRCIKAKFKSIRAYCDQTGQSYQRISQVLCGSRPMSMADVGNAIAHLGISVTFADQYSEAGRQTRRLAGNTVLRGALGAFYTPVDVAEHMLRGLDLQEGAEVLEPSFGGGAFLRAARSSNAQVKLACDIDAAACDHVAAEGLIDEKALYRGSFFDVPESRKFDAAVGNPPYVRLRAMKAGEAARLMALSARYLQAPIGEESSEWLPFLLKATAHLKPGGGLSLVLPYDFTYVRYARPSWRFLAQSFSEIRVQRVRERIFDDILQDVILFTAKGRGGACERLRYQCYETKADLLDGTTCVDCEVEIAGIVQGERPFQHAFVPEGLAAILAGSPAVVRSSQEAEMHIGYVCGNKGFFHPSAQTIEQYGLPEESLLPSVVSSRQLGKKGLRTAAMRENGWLWLPHGAPTEAERRYIGKGERENVHEGYKCRMRNPWWKVPGVSVPDMVMSVFGEAPRMLINDGGWVVTNSLLGVTLGTGVSPKRFCASWYSALTLLSIELEVHSLGGGVLVAVPREVRRIQKLKAEMGDTRLLGKIDAALRKNDLRAAYQVNDKLLAATIGHEAAEQIWQTIELIRRWRNN